jgi:hypothetical protein
MVLTRLPYAGKVEGFHGVCSHGPISDEDGEHTGGLGDAMEEMQGRVQRCAALLLGRFGCEARLPVACADGDVGSSGRRKTAQRRAEKAQG